MTLSAYKTFFHFSFYPDPSKKYSTDVVAKSLIDSSIFVAFISNNYVNDQTCCNLFKFAKTTLRKPFIIVAVGPDHEWKKSALGLLVADVVCLYHRPTVIWLLTVCGVFQNTFLSNSFFQPLV